MWATETVWKTDPADSFPPGCGVCDLPPAIGDPSEALLTELFVSSPLALLFALAVVLHALVAWPSRPQSLHLKSESNLVHSVIL